MATKKKAVKKGTKKATKKSVSKPVKSGLKKSAKGAAKRVAKKSARKPAVKLGPDGKPILPLGKGSLGYTTSNVFSQSIPEVWDAVTRPEHLKKHFITDMIGEFGSALGTVTWKWGDHPWSFEVKKYVEHSEIVFVGDAVNNKHKVTMRFEFVKRADGKTIFRIHESGYDAKDLKSAFMMCEGWTEFHCGVKTYLATGLDPREM